MSNIRIRQTKPPPSGDVASAVYRDDGAVGVCTGARRQIEGDPRHFGGSSHTVQGAPFFDVFQVLLKNPFGHLAWEKARGDGIHRDVARGQVHGQGPGEMVYGGFTGAVGKGRHTLHCGYVQSVHGADVDYARRIVRRTGIGQVG